MRNMRYLKCSELWFRIASQLGTLVFLAVWHGYHSGYYVCFFNEFITMNFERDIMNILERSPMLKPFWEHPAAPILSQVRIRNLAMALTFC